MLEYDWSQSAQRIMEYWRIGVLECRSAGWQAGGCLRRWRRAWACRSPVVSLGACFFTDVVPGKPHRDSCAPRFIPAA